MIFPEFLQTGLNRITSKITIAHQARIFRIITNGLGNGNGWGEIQRELYKRVGMGTAKYHWTRIARTEATQAYFQAHRQKNNEAGVQYERVVIARNACPICVRGEGYFQVGQTGPLPRHPFCRCTLQGLYRLPDGINVNPNYYEPDRDWVNNAVRLTNNGREGEIDFSL